MESLYFLIPIALIFVVVAIKVLFWAIKSGQYEDLDTEAHRILFDDEPPAKSHTKPEQQSNPENQVRKQRDAK